MKTKIQLVTLSLFLVLCASMVVAQEKEDSPNTKRTGAVWYSTLAQEDGTVVAAEDQARFIYLTDLALDKPNQVDTSKTMLGVNIRKTDETLRNHLKIDGDFGLVVEHVTKDSGAEEAGVKVHDVLLKFDGQLLANLDQLQKLIDLHQPDDKVLVEYFRNGNLERTEVKLTARVYVDVDLTLSGLEAYHKGIDLPHFMMDKSGNLQDCKACHAISENQLLKEGTYHLHWYRDTQLKAKDK